MSNILSGVRKFAVLGAFSTVGFYGVDGFAQPSTCAGVFGARLFNLESNNYYDVLGVDQKASFHEIRKAYRRAAMAFHPDRHPPEQREEFDIKFKKIGEAYKILSDAEKRKFYDLYDQTSTSAGMKNAQASTSREETISPSEKYRREFNKDLESLSESLTVRTLLIVYASNRKTFGPVEGFLKVLKDFYATSNDSWSDHAQVEFTDFMMKHFYADFLAHEPSSAQFLRLFKIARGNSNVRDESARNIIDKAKDYTEALRNSIFAKLVYRGSGLRLEDLIVHLTDRFNISAHEALRTYMFFAVRVRVEKTEKYSTFYENLHDGIRWLQARRTVPSLLELAHLLSTINWGKDLQSEIHGAIYSNIKDHPENLTGLEAIDPRSAQQLRTIYEQEAEKARRLDAVFKSIGR